MGDGRLAVLDLMKTGEKPSIDRAEIGFDEKIDGKSEKRTLERSS